MFSNAKDPRRHGFVRGLILEQLSYKIDSLLYGKDDETETDRHLIIGDFHTVARRVVDNSLIACGGWSTPTTGIMGVFEGHTCRMAIAHHSSRGMEISHTNIYAEHGDWLKRFKQALNDSRTHRQPEGPPPAILFNHISSFMPNPALNQKLAHRGLSTTAALR